MAWLISMDIFFVSIYLFYDFYLFIFTLNIFPDPINIFLSDGLGEEGYTMRYFLVYAFF
jgi:hypothetical protein